MKFLCTRDVVMNDGFFSYKEGCIYLSEWNDCITDEEGDDSHIWTEPEDYFIPLQKVEYVWTDATPELKKLFENYTGKREGQRRDMSKVRYFSNQSVNPQDTAFTAYESFDPLFYDLSCYMAPSTFIEFMGLEAVKQEVGKDMDYEFYIGRNIIGFKFSQSDYPAIGWDDGMEGNIYRAGVIEGYNESNNSFSVRFEDLKAWCYPADMVVDQIERKGALVELSNSESYEVEEEVTVEGDAVNQFKEITDSIASLLQYKNEKYGNSALDPLKIFGGKCKVGTRIDDKLARIKNSKELLKNDISDLIGYAVLICKENGWTNFDEFKD